MAELVEYEVLGTVTIRYSVSTIVKAKSEEAAEELAQTLFNTWSPTRDVKGVDVTDEDISGEIDSVEEV